MDNTVASVQWHALGSRVIVAARTRVEGTWAAYIDAVPGIRHSLEVDAVLAHGCKLSPEIARVLFPEFADLPYAR